MSMAVTTAAIVSEMGMASHTPSVPSMGGSAKTSGKRKIICRESERKMLTLALPILWMLLFFVYDLLIDRLAVVYRRRRGKKA